MMPLELRSEIEALLAGMARAAADLSDALAQERAALRELDVATLESTSQIKQRALAALEESERARSTACARSGVARTAQGMLTLLAKLGDGGVLAQRWAQLTATLATCRNDNRATGALLALNKRRVTEALALLCGGTTVRDLYGPDGQALHDPPRAPLASA